MKILCYFIFILLLSPGVFSAEERKKLTKKELAEAEKAPVEKEKEKDLIRGKVMLGGENLAVLDRSTELAFSDKLEPAAIEQHEALERFRLQQISPYTGTAAARLFPETGMYILLHPGTASSVSYYDTRSGARLHFSRGGDFLTEAEKAFAKLADMESLRHIVAEDRVPYLLRERIARTDGVCMFPADTEKKNVYRLIYTAEGFSLKGPGGMVLCTGKKTAEIYGAMCEALQLNAIPPLNTEDEVRILIEEYEMLCRNYPSDNPDQWNNAPLVKRINDLSGLQPANPRWEQETIYLGLCRLLWNETVPEERAAILRDSLKKMKDFVQKYPSYRYPTDRWGKVHVFSTHTFLPFEPMQTSGGDRTQKLLEECAALENVLRNPVSQNGMNGAKQTVPRVVTLSDRLWKKMDSDMNEMKKSNKKNISFRNQFPYPFMEEETADVKSKDAWESITELFRKNGKAFLDLHKTLSGEENYIRYLDLRALHDFLLSKRTKADMENVYRRYLKERFSDPIQIFRTGKYNGYLKTAVKRMYDYGDPRQTELLTVLDVYPYQYLFTEGNLSAVNKWHCLRLSGAEDPQWLIANADAIRELADLRTLDKNRTEILSLLVRDLCANMKDNVFESALRTLNKDVTLGIIPLPEKHSCIASCETAGNVYLLLESPEGLLSVYSFDPGKNTLSDCSMPPVIRRDFQPQTITGDNPVPIPLMPVGKQILVGGKGVIAQYDTESGKWNMIRYPGENPVCAAVSGGRCYILCGGTPGDNSADLTVQLYSFKTDGSDLQMITGYYPLNGAVPARVSGLTATEDGRLRFILNSTNRFTDMYEYAISQNQLRKVYSFPSKIRDFMARSMQDGTLFGYAGLAHNIPGAYFTFAHRDGTPRWLMGTPIQSDHTVAYPFSGTAVFRMPAVKCGDYLHTAGGNIPAVIHMRHPEQSPKLFLPRAENVYCFPGKKLSVYTAAEEGYIFTVKINMEL